MATKAFKIKVSGRVQRVGFRRYVLDLAQDMNVSGYISNLADGSVEVFAQGEDLEIKKFVEELKKAPYPVVIKDLVVKEDRLMPEFKTFSIRYGSIQEELQEGFGAMQSIFMEYWKEFREYRQEFRDFRNEFRDFRDESLKLSREILSEVKELRNDLKTILDKRIAKMERDIAEIKARLGMA